MHKGDLIAYEYVQPVDGTWAWTIGSLHSVEKDGVVTIVEWMDQRDGIKSNSSRARELMEEAEYETLMADRESQQLAQTRTQMIRHRQLNEESVQAAKAQLEAARFSVESINPAHLREIQTYRTPPTVVKKTVSAVLQRMRLARRDDSWDTCKIALRNHMFISNIVQFDPQNEDTERLEELLLFIGNDPSMTVDQAYQCSKAAGPLLQWLLAQLNATQVNTGARTFEYEVGDTTRRIADLSQSIQKHRERAELLKDEAEAAQKLAGKFPQAKKVDRRVSFAIDSGGIAKDSDGDVTNLWVSRTAQHTRTILVSSILCNLGPADDTRVLSEDDVDAISDAQNAASRNPNIRLKEALEALSERDTRNESLQRRLDLLEKECAALRDDKGHLVSMLADADAANAALGELKASHQALLKKMKIIEEENDCLLSQLTTARRECDDLKRHIADLEGKASTAASERRDLEDLVISSRRDADSHKTTIAEQRKKMDDLSAALQAALAAKEETRGDLNRTTQELEEEIRKGRKREEELAALCTKMDAEAKTAINGQVKELEDLSAKMTTMAATISDLENELSQSKKDHATEKKRSQELTAQLGNRSEALKAVEEEHNKAVMELEQKIAVLTRERSERDADHARSEAKSREDLQSIQVQLKHASEESKSLTEKLVGEKSARRGDVELLRLEIGQLQAEASALRAGNQHLVEEANREKKLRLEQNEEMEKRKAEHQELLRCLEQGMANMRQEVTERSLVRETELERKQSGKMKDLEAALDQLSQMRQDHKEVLDREARLRNELVEQLTLAKADKMALQMKHEELQRGNAGLHQEADRLNGQLGALRAKLGEKETEVAELEQQCHKHSDEVNQLKGTVTTLQQDIASREKQVVGLQERVEQLQHDHRIELEKRKAEYQQIIDTFNAGMARLRDESRDRSVEREDELQRKEKELETALERLKEASKEHKEMIEIESKHRKELVEQLASAREESAEARASLQRAEEHALRERSKAQLADADAVEKINAKQAQLDDLVSELARERRDRASQQEEMEKRKREHQQLIDCLQQGMSEIRSETTERSVVREAELERKQSGRMKDLETALHQLSQMRNDHKEALEREVNMRNDLVEQLTTSRVDKISLQKRVDDMTHAAETARAELLRLESQVESLSARVVQLQSVNGQLVNENDRVKSELHKTAEAVAAADANLVSKVKHLRVVQDELDDHKRLLAAERIEAERRAVEHQNIISTFNAGMARLRDESRDRSIEREEELRRKERDLESALDQLSRSNKEHRAMLDADSKLRADYAAQLSAARDESHAAQMREAKLQSDLAEQVASSRRDVDRLVDLLEQAEAKLLHSADREEHLSAEVDALQSRSLEQEEQLAKAYGDMEDMESRLEILEQEKIDLERQVELYTKMLENDRAVYAAEIEESSRRQEEDLEMFVLLQERIEQLEDSVFVKAAENTELKTQLEDYSEAIEDVARSAARYEILLKSLKTLIVNTRTARSRSIPVNELAIIHEAHVMTSPERRRGDLEHEIEDVLQSGSDSGSEQNAVDASVDPPPCDVSHERFITPQTESIVVEDSEEAVTTTTTTTTVSRIELFLHHVQELQRSASSNESQEVLRQLREELERALAESRRLNASRAAVEDAAKLSEDAESTESEEDEYDIAYRNKLIESAELQHKLHVSQLESQLADLREEAEVLRQRLAQQTCLNEQMLQTLYAIRSEHERCASHEAQLRSEIRIAEENLTREADVVQALREKAQDSKSKVDELTRSLEAYEERVETYEAEHRELKKQLTSVASEPEEFQALRVELAHLHDREKLRDLVEEEQAERFQSELAHLAHKLADAERTRRQAHIEYKASLASLQETHALSVEDLARQLDNAWAQEESLLQQLQDRSEQAEVTRLRVAELEGLLRSSEALLRERNASLVDLTGQLEQHRISCLRDHVHEGTRVSAELDALTLELRRLRQSHDEDQNEKTRLGRELASISTRCADAERECDRRKKQLEDSHRQLQKSRSEYQGQIDELQARVRALQEEQSRLAKEQTSAPEVSPRALATRALTVESANHSQDSLDDDKVRVSAMVVAATGLISHKKPIDNERVFVKLATPNVRYETSANQTIAGNATFNDAPCEFFLANPEVEVITFYLWARGLDPADGRERCIGGNEVSFASLPNGEHTLTLPVIQNFKSSREQQVGYMKLRLTKHDPRQTLTIASDSILEQSSSTPHDRMAPTKRSVVLQADSAESLVVRGKPLTGEAVVLLLQSNGQSFATDPVKTDGLGGAKFSPRPLRFYYDQSANHATMMLILSSTEAGGSVVGSNDLTLSVSQPGVHSTYIPIIESSSGEKKIAGIIKMSYAVIVDDASPIPVLLGDRSIVAPLDDSALRQPIVVPPCNEPVRAVVAAPASERTPDHRVGSKNGNADSDDGARVTELRSESDRRAQTTSASDARRHRADVEARNSGAVRRIRSTRDPSAAKKSELAPARRTVDAHLKVTIGRVKLLMEDPTILGVFVKVKSVAEKYHSAVKTLDTGSIAAIDEQYPFLLAEPSTDIIVVTVWAKTSGLISEKLIGTVHFTMAMLYRGVERTRVASIVSHVGTKNAKRSGRIEVRLLTEDYGQKHRPTKAEIDAEEEAYRRLEVFLEQTEPQHLHQVDVRLALQASRTPR